jgi:large subunit ribosomal protein L7/L12
MPSFSETNNNIRNLYLAEANATIFVPSSPAARQVAALEKQADSLKAQNLSLGKIERAILNQNYHLSEMVNIGKEVVLKLDKIGEVLVGIEQGIDQLVTIQLEILERHKLQDKVNEIVFIIERFIKKYTEINKKSEEDEWGFYENGCEIISTLNNMYFTTQLIQENKLKHSFADSIELIKNELDSLKSKPKIYKYIDWLGELCSNLATETQNIKSELDEKELEFVSVKDEIKNNAYWSPLGTIFFNLLLIPFIIFISLFTLIVVIDYNWESTFDVYQAMPAILVGSFVLMLLNICHSLYQLTIGNGRRYSKIKELKTKTDELNEIINPISQNVKKYLNVTSIINELHGILNMDREMTNKFTHNVKAVSNTGVANLETEFDVYLVNDGGKKIATIKAVRNIIAGLGLADAKKMVESTPITIMEAVAKDVAENAVVQLKESGAVVELKSN